MCEAVFENYFISLVDSGLPDKPHGNNNCVREYRITWCLVSPQIPLPRFVHLPGTTPQNFFCLLKKKQHIIVF